MATLTKIFKQGNSQAVRIPADFRMDAAEVEIRKTAGGLLILDHREAEKTLAALRGIQEDIRRRRRRRRTASLAHA